MMFNISVFYKPDLNLDETQSLQCSEQFQEGCDDPDGGLFADDFQLSSHVRRAPEPSKTPDDLLQDPLRFFTDTTLFSYLFSVLLCDYIYLISVQGQRESSTSHSYCDQCHHQH